MADRTVIETVLSRAQRSPDELCVRTFSRRAKEAARTLGQVAEAAGRAAAFYHQQGLRQGDVVVLVGTHHIDFYAAWLGCVWLGAVPTVLAEPSVRVSKEIYWSRMAELLHRIHAWGLVTDPKIQVEQELAAVPRCFTYDETTACQATVPSPIAAELDSTLLLQHSSGTTGLHKGVMLSHRAVWRHAESYNRQVKMDRSDVIASWLPLYHDMGFIACFLTPLLLGVPVVWLSPFEWVANPGLLLEAVTRHRATLAWLPNFAFPFLAQRVKAEPGQFDLSSLRAVVNCSEPVSHEAMQAFVTRYSGFGFSPTAVQTCYAMAENVFAVTTSDDEFPPQQRFLDPTIWREEHRAVALPAHDERAIVHVSSGRPVADCDLRIRDSMGRELPPACAGEVWIHSPFLFSGYFHRDDLQSDLFDPEGFYNTGDIGYVDESGNVFITGRSKDLIIIGGKNLYPQDVEEVVNRVDGVHAGRVVAFGVPMRGTGTEGLVVLVESDEVDTAWPDVVERIRRALPSRLDVDVTDARVVERGLLRKSTSGKLARDGNRQWYLGGAFGAVPDAVLADR